MIIEIGPALYDAVSMALKVAFVWVVIHYSAVILINSITVKTQHTNIETVKEAPSDAA